MEINWQPVFYDADTDAYIIDGQRLNREQLRGRATLTIGGTGVIPSVFIGGEATTIDPNDDIVFIADGNTQAVEIFKPERVFSVKNGHPYISKEMIQRMFFELEEAAYYNRDGIVRKKDLKELIKGDETQ